MKKNWRENGDFHEKELKRERRCSWKRTEERTEIFMKKSWRENEDVHEKELKRERRFSWKRTKERTEIFMEKNWRENGDFHEKELKKEIIIYIFNREQRKEKNEGQNVQKRQRARKNRFV